MGSFDYKSVTKNNNNSKIKKRLFDINYSWNYQNIFFFYLGIFLKWIKSKKFNITVTQ